MPLHSQHPFQSSGRNCNGLDIKPFNHDSALLSLPRFRLCFLETQEKLSFALFEKELSSFSQMESAWDSIVEATRFLIIDLGWPMVVGSLFFAIPGAFLSYWITAYLLKRYRLQRLKHRQFVANGSQPVDQPIN